jgi:hypothetical protein
MTRHHRPIAALVAGVLLVAACGGSGGDDEATESTRRPRRTTTTDAPERSTAPDVTESTERPEATEPPTTVAADGGLIRSDGTVDEAAFDALSAEHAALPEAEQRARAADLDRRVERQMWTLAGMDDALGGSAAADEVFAGLYAQYAAEVEAVRQQPIELVGLRSTSPHVDEAFGAGLVGTLLLQGFGGKALIEQTNTGTRGFGTANGLTMLATDDRVTIGFDHKTSYGGADLTIHTTNDFQVCPDANGMVEVTSTSDVHASAGAAAGIQAKVEVRSLFQLDDNADVAENSYSRHIEYTKTAGGSSKVMDITTGLDGRNTLTFASWFGSVEFFQETFALGSLVGLLANAFNLLAAQAAWESGRCIDLQTAVSAGPTGLDPNASVTITARPRVKADGSNPGGTVSALLSGGEVAVDPSSTPLPADAEFTYTAPGERDKTGQVSLESRSKRGVGKAVINFDTKSKSAFAATGGGGDWAATGTICDLEQTFELSGTGLTVTTFPVDAAGGAYLLGGNAGGAEWSGEGTYTVALAADGRSGTLTISGTNTVHSPFGDYSDVAEASFTLTAIEPC